MNTFELKTIAWAEQRKIVPNSNPSTQLLKAVSELGELADATIKGNMDDIMDGVGDVLVCLAIYCKLQDTNMAACWDRAWREIEHRKGTLLPNGVFVKESK
jgi:NTP pyrophosphatase (non-canonical NTP hydrolase)